MVQDVRLQKRLGKRCKEMRRLKGLSQLDIVRTSEFSLSHYQKIERGALDPRLSTIERMADCFDVELSELLEGV